MNTHGLYDVFQFLAVAALVTLCTVYCLLTLAPGPVKRGVKKVLLALPLPKFIASRLARTGAAGTCASQCGACASPSKKVDIVKWHARKP